MKKSWYIIPENLEQAKIIAKWFDENHGCDRNKAFYQDEVNDGGFKINIPFGFDPDKPGHVLHETYGNQISFTEFKNKTSNNSVTLEFTQTELHLLATALTTTITDVDQKLDNKDIKIMVKLSAIVLGKESVKMLYKISDYIKKLSPEEEKEAGKRSAEIVLEMFN